MHLQTATGTSQITQWDATMKNYRPNIPVEYHSDVMYVEPSEEVWSKVKDEKTERSEFWANLKAKKYAGKEQIESVAFGYGEAKM